MSGECVIMWPGSPRLTLDGGHLRLLALTELLLTAAGGRVRQGAPATAPEGLRRSALSWLHEHDAFLRATAARLAGIPAPLAPSTPGDGVVVSTDVAAVARQAPTDSTVPVIRVQWAVDAGRMLNPPVVAPAALALTRAEARALAAAGVDAVSLLDWAEPPPLRVPADRAGRVVVVVAALDGRLLADVVASVRAAIAPDGRHGVVIDVLADGPVATPAGARHPVHPWTRSRVVAGADLVLAVGDGPAGDLTAAEAVLNGVPAWRVLREDFPGPLRLGVQVPLAGLPRPADPVLAMLAEALPARLRLTPMDDEVVAGPPLGELAQWLHRTAAGSSAKQAAGDQAGTGRRREGPLMKSTEDAAAMDRPSATPSLPGVCGAPGLLPPGAEIYAGVVGQSLHLAAAQHGPAAAAVSLVLPPLEPDRIFAGVGTALEFGRRLALALGRPLRVVPLQDAPGEPLQDAITAFLAREGKEMPELSVVPQPMLGHLAISGDDVWVVTYWTTAHAAHVACELGVIDPRRVVYLVQDYEPGFHAWSVPFALTRATYHAGFHHVINSRPLANYLAAREGEEVDHGLVLAPHLDLDRLAIASRNRRAAAVMRVFFYGRPSKPRNLYQLGAAALRYAATRLAADGVAWEAVSAGEEHPDIALPGGAVARCLGTLDWAGYFGLLATTDVGLTLMHSPHPSHPPLEVAVSGGLAVTNDLDGARQGLHPRIVAVPADVVALGDALVAAVHRARRDGPGPFVEPEEGVLGDRLDVVVGRLLERLG